MLVTEFSIGSESSVDEDRLLRACHNSCVAALKPLGNYRRAFFEILLWSYDNEMDREDQRPSPKQRRTLLNRS